MPFARRYFITALSFILFFGCWYSCTASLQADNPVSGLSVPGKDAFSNQPVKICLTMIVKNESKIIERCLNSAKEVVDCIVICDTGSTDNTVEIIQQFMKNTGIPGKIYQHQWKNFGHNRTLSVAAAKETLAELVYDLSHTYLLMLDADMLLQIKPDFEKQHLVADSYFINQKEDSLFYANLRLLRASLPWISVGVTHEYWSSPFADYGKLLHSLEIDDRGDGGAKADKFERDIKLLLKGLAEEPDNDRYMFYLAQSYYCIKEYEQSIKWYKKRIEKGGWEEEVWYSKYMIGENYREWGQWENALAWYLEAYQDNPARAEPLQRIASYYRLNGKNELAYLFAKLGSAIPFPKEQILFISHPVYQYQFDEEISIAAFYLGKKEEGLLASNRLVLKKEVPHHIKHQAYVNLLYYIDPLKDVQYIPIEISLPHVAEGSASRYNPTNPSILKTENGYQVICRTVNYIQFGAHTFKTIDPADDVIRTRNFLLDYDKNFNLLSQHEIVENLPRHKYSWRKVEGLEDCRIVEINKENWFTCCTDDASPHARIEIILCKLAKNPVGQYVNVESLTPFRIPKQQGCEKNWLPFTVDNALHMIYGYQPFIVLQPDMKSGACKEIAKYEPEYDFSNFRGSAAPVPFDDGYLMMVHEIATKDQRFYMNRFLYLDKNFVITKASKPFYFKNKGVEICLGMTKDHSEKKLVMGIGIEDREAYLALVDLDTVRGMLEELDISQNH